MCCNILPRVSCLLLWISFAAGDVGYFWHVTDLHYDHTYWTSRLSCLEPVPKPGKYGDYWCDSPWALVQDSIASMANITADVDFILWTGDSVAHIADANLTLNLNLEIVANITETLNTSFPQVPVYASLGNHDFYPSNQADYNQSEIYDQVSEMWENWISNQTQVEQFRQGGYYVARIAPKLRLLALNTNLYYTNNKLTANVSDPAGQMAWLDDQLKDARSKGDKVIVTGHIPPSVLTPGLADWFYPKHKTQFVDILLQNSDVIVASLFGHDHSDGFKIIQDETGSRAVTQFTAPSVTPWTFRTASKTADPHNPGIRLVTYDRNTGLHLGYEQYYINLTDSNRNGRTAWTRLYSFTEAYNVSDMSVASLRKIFSLMASDKGTVYSNKYCTYSVVSNYPINCTEAARADIYCGGLHYDLQEAQDCKHKYLASLNGASGLSLNVFVVTGVILVKISAFILQ
ncbi:unnamed protein product [Candidula unifasciata]|uniref:Acid sphingomyelinase-like phosphodiesterase n=1 Tax=Candidula unifasciata TaxID=100452 RepID=A0A8S3YZQ1_9EUPU|nr:unnamed protein product [Candidula unifasciata]